MKYLMIAIIVIAVAIAIESGFEEYLHYRIQIKEETEKTNRESIELAKKQVELQKNVEEYKLATLKSEHYEKYKSRL